ncbi:unnamed protein product [Phytomonas sp. Hart1]|nr:unnamed protein product [Phytomonas sp. Hart1]|eukprot:CCW67744.1 unnamed protein product [Phytomonas sp. isolate Hart1]
MSDNDYEKQRNEALLYSDFPPPPTLHNPLYQVTPCPPNFQSSQEQAPNPYARVHYPLYNSPGYSQYPHVYHPTEAARSAQPAQDFFSNSHSNASSSILGLHDQYSHGAMPQYEQHTIPPPHPSQVARQFPWEGGLCAPELSTVWPPRLEPTADETGNEPQAPPPPSEPPFPLPPTSTIFKRHPPKCPHEPPPSLRQSQPIEFVKGSPQYTQQLVLLFAASFFGMVPLLSYFSLATLLCCAVCTYLLDYLGFTRSTIAALFVTALLFSIALFLSNLHTLSTSIGPIFMILDVGALLALATAAVALHFRYLQENYPEFICVLDRIVMGLAPILALPFLLTSIIALGGSRRAPLWLLVVMCIESYYFYCPINSIFTCARQLVMEPHKDSASSTREYLPDKSKASYNNRYINEKANEDITDQTDLVTVQLNERIESIVFTFLLLTLPIAVYVTLQSNFFDNFIPNVFNCFGLLCSGVGYLCAFPTRTFWFLVPENAKNEDDDYQRLAYDPYGLELLISMHRFKIVVFVCISVINWMAYRLVRCRYRYLFDGIPYPFNFIVLLLALYILLYAIIQTKFLLDADSAGENKQVNHFSRQRISTVLSVVIVTLLFCLLMDAPGVFYFLGALGVLGFNMFLMDRSAGGPIAYYIVFSSLLLLWWMYRTFSFVVLDLHVLGSSAIVSTSAVAIGVLFSHILGWVSFAFSFQNNIVLLTIFLSLHATEVSFVEEVLYSQKEEGSYPAVLVAFTSGVGIYMTWSLYKNEVLTLAPSAFLASFYVAKGFVFLVEVTGSYYEADMEWNSYFLTISAIEINAGWVVALFASYIVAIFEIQGRLGVRVRNAKLFICSYTIAAGLLSLLTIRNLQRAVYEFVTRSYIGVDDLLHIAFGTGLSTFCLLTLCFFSRHKARYDFLIHLVPLMSFSGIVGVLMLVVQPTRITDYRSLSSDYKLYAADRGQYATALGILLLILGFYVPLWKLSEVPRGLYWGGTALVLSFGIITTLLPISTVPLFCTVSLVMFFDLIVLDFAHYRRLESIEIWVLYALSICGIIASFITLRRVKLLQAIGGDVSLALVIHEEARTRFLSIMAVINLFLVILLRARLSGRPLLSGCTPLRPFIVSQLSVLCNGAVLFTVGILYLLNFLCNNGESSFYVSCSLLLALLVDEKNTISKIQRVRFSYFFMISSMLTVLWLSFLSEGWKADNGFGGIIKLMVSTLIFSFPLLLSQASLLARFWYFRGTRYAHFKDSRFGYGVVLIMVMINTLALVFTSCRRIQWMCIVTICGEAMLVIRSRHLHSKI